MYGTRYGSIIADKMIDDECRIGLEVLFKLLEKRYAGVISDREFLSSLDQQAEDCYDLIRREEKEHGQCPGCKYC